AMARRDGSTGFAGMRIVGAMEERAGTRSWDRVAIAIVDKVQREGAYASTAIADAFREKTYAADARRSIARAVSALLRRGRSASILAYDAQERLEFARAIDAGDPAAIDRLWQAASTVQGRAAQLGVSSSIPDALAAALIADYGDEADALAHALSMAPPTILRTNAAKIDRDALLDELRHDGVSCRANDATAHAIEVDDRPHDLFETAAFREGRFEVQDAGSQLVAECVAPPPGGLVVDACAGEGGKALAIAATMSGRGRIVATDVSATKLEALKKRARRADARNVQTIAIDADGPLPDPLLKLLGKVDRVLVDAPCSGTGSLRRNPEAKRRDGFDDFDRYPPIQRAIVERFLPLVRPGGRLVYATCSLLARENARVVEATMAAHPELEAMRVVQLWGRARGERWSDATGTYLAARPDRHGTDGLFAAILRRRN
ncbi:MAG: RsmB/NOP family class I SAM-dependent RNA methyltransferase, partial [Polyangiales bacterium]